MTKNVSNSYIDFNVNMLLVLKRFAVRALYSILFIGHAAFFEALQFFLNTIDKYKVQYCTISWWQYIICFIVRRIGSAQDIFKSRCLMCSFHISLLAILGDNLLAFN